MKKTFILFILAAVVACSGCSSNDDNGVQVQNQESSGKTLDIEAALAAQGFTVTGTCTVDGRTGYLSINSDGKRCVVLTGTPWTIGYQMGRMLPEDTYNMTREYPYCMMKEFIGIGQEQAPTLYENLIAKVLELSRREAEKGGAIPAYLVEEMKGMAQGATDGGRDVRFDDVLLLNEGFDALMAMLYTGELIAKIPELFGCNAFTVSGKATNDGHVYFGRDFMFPTGKYTDVKGYFSDHALMAIYLPDEGYPFVSVTTAGFVAQSVGMNSEGLSMGCDVVFSGATRNTPGMSVLLVIRDIVQFCPDLDSAVNRMKAQNRGVAWIYPIADDEFSPEYTNGIVVEEGMSSPGFTGPDLLGGMTRLLLGSLLDSLGDEMPDKGIMVRSQSWKYPEAFKKKKMFPEQIEDYDDVVVTANHYIIPRMVLTSNTPLMTILNPLFKKGSESEDRYEDLVSLISKSYGSIDFEKARELIDFMNPNRGRWDTYKVTGPVEGHHDVIDNTARVIESLFGYYNPDEPWVRIDLSKFLSDL